MAQENTPIKVEAVVVGAEEAEYAGHLPGSPVPDFEKNQELIWSQEGEDLSWMDEKRPDGTYKYCRSKRRKRPGMFCKQLAMAGMNRCRLHGGKSPRGIAHSSFSSGRYSKSLGRTFRKLYKEHKKDPDMLAMDGEIAYLRARIEELMQLRDVGNTADAWKGAREATKAMVRAKKYNDQALFDVAFDKLVDFMLMEVDYNYHKEITLQIEQLRKVIDTETKRRIQLQQLVTSDEFMTAINVFVKAVKLHVSDTKQKQAVLSDIQRQLVTTN